VGIGDDGGNHLWSTAQTWHTNVTPGPADAVCVGMGFTIEVDVDACILSITQDGPPGSLVIDPGVTFTVNDANDSLRGRSETYVPLVNHGGVVVEAGTLGILGGGLADGTFVGTGGGLVGFGGN